MEHEAGRSVTSEREVPRGAARAVLEKLYALGRPSTKRELEKLLLGRFAERTIRRARAELERRGLIRHGPGPHAVALVSDRSQRPDVRPATIVSETGHLAGHLSGQCPDKIDSHHLRSIISSSSSSSGGTPTRETNETRRNDLEALAAQIGRYLLAHRPELVEQVLRALRDPPGSSSPAPTPTPPPAPRDRQACAAPERRVSRDEPPPAPSAPADPKLKRAVDELVRQAHEAAKRPGGKPVRSEAGLRASIEKRLLKEPGGLEDALRQADERESAPSSGGYRPIKLDRPWGIDIPPVADVLPLVLSARTPEEIAEVEAANRAYDEARRQRLERALAKAIA